MSSSRNGIAFALLKVDSLLIHEQVDATHLAVLTARLLDDGEVRQPVIVDRESRVILDGHHRVTALRGLGCTLVPAYLVDYADPGIKVMPRRPEIPVSKVSVVETGLSGHPYPPKTSRHVFPFEPAAKPVPLSALRPLPKGNRLPAGETAKHTP